MVVRVGQAPYLECSSRGDSRFSAFNAHVFGKSIESHYQGAKVFADGETGLSWRHAKGRRPINAEEVALLYKELWRHYLSENAHLYDVLAQATGLSDLFGKAGRQCQAMTLWELRNEYLEARS